MIMITLQFKKLKGFCGVEGSCFQLQFKPKLEQLPTKKKDPQNLKPNSL
jgi:hypothetical protein